MNLISSASSTFSRVSKSREVFAKNKQEFLMKLTDLKPFPDDQ